MSIQLAPVDEKSYSVNFHVAEPTSGKFKRDTNVDGDVIAMGKIGALLQAANDADVDKLRSLIASGVSVNSADYDRRTALHVACSEGHENIVKFLLNQPGINPEPIDRFRCTPLDEAIINKRNNIVHLFKVVAGARALKPHAQERINTMLIEAASIGDVKEVKELLATGCVNVNCHDYDRRTPLHLAVNNCHPQVVDILLSSGADPKFQDRWGNTPVADAIRRSHADKTRQAIKDLFHKHGGSHPGMLSMFTGFFLFWVRILNPSNFSS